MRTFFLQTLLIAALLPRLDAADAAEPLRVCALLANLTAYEGKIVVLVGRYSFRESGRTLSEEKCGEQPGGALHISFDKKSAPPTPESLDLDGTTVRKLLADIQRQTSLAKFKFGTPDYDRWAVVYGRVQHKPAGAAPAQIVCAGDGVVHFLFEVQ